jgi:hypothetical protein
MIQLRRAGLVADREDVERLRIQFAEMHWVRLTSLLEQQLLSRVLSDIEQGNWRESGAARFYSESNLEPGPALSLLKFVTNSPKFLEVISEITGCDSLNWFDGRVYRMQSNAGHKDEWHNDTGKNRQVAMSLNLSPRGYGGGVLQMREAKSHRMIAEIANTGLGDAVLFRLSKDLEHYVTDVQAGEPKTAFAGWFSAEEGMMELLIIQKAIQRAPSPLE